MPGDRGYPSKHLIRDYIISKGAMGAPVSASLTKVRMQPPSDNGVPYQPLDNRDFTPQAPTSVLTVGVSALYRISIVQSFLIPISQWTWSIDPPTEVQSETRASKYLFIVSGDQFVC